MTARELQNRIFDLLHEDEITFDSKIFIMVEKYKGEKLIPYSLDNYDVEADNNGDLEINPFQTPF